MPADLLPVSEALAIVAGAFRPLPAEIVSIGRAFGRVLAEDVAARLTHPPADVSAMDGYAVRAADVEHVPASLRVIGRSSAGSGLSGTLGAGEAVRIFTGAPVPPGADTIVIQEQAEERDGRVVFGTRTARDRHIRTAGLDFARGDVVLRAGRRLTARDVALAAAMNVPWLAVRRKPRVAVLATGDEVVMPGEPVGPDQIVSSVTFALIGMLNGFGAEPVSLGIARDDPSELARHLEAARDCDLLLTIGGASVGEFDLVRRAFAAPGARQRFGKVAMRPGKPLIFGHLGDLPVMALPGNPVSACVALTLFGQAAIAAMLGLDRSATPSATARLGCALPANGDRQDYLRATLSRNADGELVAIPFALQDSSMLRTLAAADCLIVRPPHAPPAAEGSRVVIIALDGSLIAG